MSVKLTKPQRSELARLALATQDRSPGRARARVQNKLVALGFARFYGPTCVITAEGRAALEKRGAVGA